MKTISQITQKCLQIYMQHIQLPIFDNIIIFLLLQCIMFIVNEPKDSRENNYNKKV